MLSGGYVLGWNMFSDEYVPRAITDAMSAIDLHLPPAGPDLPELAGS